MTLHRVGHRAIRPSMRAVVAPILAYLLPLSGLFLVACDSGFQAVSVYPASGEDVYETEIHIYGHGFEEGAAATVTWADSTGQLQSAPINNLEYIDEYTLKGTLPSLSGELVYPIYPYVELIDYWSDVTPGLYSCDTGEEVLWSNPDETYCDELGSPLLYTEGRANSSAPDDYPPGDPGLDVFDYYSWYELLLYCALNFYPDYTAVPADWQEDLFSRLIPDYGYGCYYQKAPDGTIIYKYCPARTPATEVNIVVTQPDGSVSEISRGFTYFDPDLDYYWSTNYNSRVQGFFGDAYPVSESLAPSAITLADLDGDDIPDPVILSSEAATLSVFLSNWGAEDSVVDIPPEVLAPEDVAFADLNSDSYIDLVTANADSRDITYWLGQTPESGSYQNVGFESMETLPLPTSETIDIVPKRLALSDLNFDGLTDIAVLSTVYDSESEITSGKLLVSLQNFNDGQFEDWNEYAISAEPSDFVVGDLNSDGTPDIAVAHALEMAFTLYSNQGDGSFTSSLYLPESSQTERTQAATTPKEDSTEDEGSDTVQGQIAVSYEMSDSMYSTRALTDFNLDGNLDMAVLLPASGELMIMNGDGLGAFNSTVTFALPNTPRSATIGFADDGATDNPSPDIITILEDGDLYVQFNDSMGGFEDSHELAPFYFAGYEVDPRIIVAQDFDGYPDHDLMVVSTGTDTVFSLDNPATLYTYYRYVLYRCLI